MKKHLLSAAVGLALTTVSFTSNAEDLAQIYRLALNNDPAGVSGKIQPLPKNKPTRQRLSTATLSRI